MKGEQHRHVQKTKQLKRTLALMPEGHLSFCNNSYYNVIQNQGTRRQLIIPKDYDKREQLISDLQQKRHIQKSLPILEANLKACSQFLEKFQVYDLAEINQKMPFPYQNFDYSPLLLDGDVRAESWTTDNYHKNTSYPEHLIHHSDGGIVMRSKAEAMIATKLEQNGLQFRYDSLQKFGNHWYSPDFMILHPVHRRIIYWEHFGRMDDYDYIRDAMDRVRVYGEHGIFAGDNLIITWESKQDPLTYQHINDRIRRHFK